MTKRKRNRHASRQFHRLSAPGSPPGTLTIDPCAPKPIVQVMAYGAESFHECTLTDLAPLNGMLSEYATVWVNVDGLGDADTIRQLGQIFHLHPLALEDVVNVHQRAKVEQYGDHLFIVARMVELNDHLGTEQVSIFLGRNFVLTFLEDPGDSFDPVRQRLRGNSGRIRNSGTGYLAYALLDAAVDAYFPVLEQFGERLDALEDTVILRPNKEAISKIHDVKRDLRLLRRAAWPMREAVNSLSRDPSPLIHDDTRPYLRDCYDHTVQILDLVETYRELGADMTDLYLSSLSNRLNEVMKVLTMIATIFMPLSFVAGVYGMNFDPAVSPWNMPELKWPFGYEFALTLMLGTLVAMLLLFRRRGWLGGNKENSNDELRMTNQ